MARVSLGLAGRWLPDPPAEYVLCVKAHRSTIHGTKNRSLTGETIALKAGITYTFFVTINRGEQTFNVDLLLLFSGPTNRFA